MATAMTKSIGLSLELACPKCMAKEGAIKIDLNDLGGNLECSECSEEFSIVNAIGILEDALTGWRIARSMVEFAVAAKRKHDADDTAF